MYVHGKLRTGVDSLCCYVLSESKMRVRGGKPARLNFVKDEEWLGGCLKLNDKRVKEEERTAEGPELT